MLHNKDIKKISELKIGFTPTWSEPDFIYGLFKALSYKKVCSDFNVFKKKGYSFYSIFSVLISLTLLGEATVSSLTSGVWNKLLESGKDVFYRLKNNYNVNWRMILLHFAMHFVSKVQQETQYREGVKCVIFDDTTMSKTGKKIEYLGRVWDHVRNISILGFKMLAMGYWDGASFIPIDFSMHREKGKNKEKPYGMKKKDLKKQFHKKRPTESHGYKRAKELDCNKIQMALKMFWQAVLYNFKIDYVLLDSWFTCEDFVRAVKKVEKQTIHLIGMYKVAKQKFKYAGQMLTYSQIRNMLGTPKRCRKARLFYNEAIVMLNDIEVKLFFSRQGKNGKWKVLLTTDLEITFIKLIEIYQIRWTIEVFFKESKQLLGLGKCQSSDFDGQIAEATINMVQYILLTLRHRFDIYESKGEIFRQGQNELLELRLNERLWGLLLEILNIIEDIFDTDAMELLQKIITNEETCRKLSAMFALDTSKILSKAA